MKGRGLPLVSSSEPVYEKCAHRHEIDFQNGRSAAKAGRKFRNTVRWTKRNQIGTALSVTRFFFYLEKKNITVVRGGTWSHVFMSYPYDRAMR